MTDLSFPPAMTAEAGGWFAICKTITMLHDDARLTGRPLSPALAPLEDALIALLPGTYASGDLVAAAIAANAPRALRALVEKHGAGECLDIAGPALLRSAREVIRTGETEAMIEYLRLGGNFPCQSLRDLTAAIRDNDCHRRLALLLAIPWPIPDFNGRLLDILEQAGPRLGAMLMDLEDNPQSKVTLAATIISQGALRITLKQFALLLTRPRDIEKTFDDRFERFFAPPALDLIDKTRTAHGRMALAAMEPDRAALFGRAPGLPFFGLSSQSNLLVDIPYQKET